jgi:hypothetical protein
MIFKNIICIDLTKFKKEEDIKKILEDNGIKITKKIEPFVLWHLRTEVSKIYYDPTVDKYAIFEDTEGDVHYLEYFLEQLDSIPPLDIKKCFTVNDILDKINKYGVGSLTKEEKDFLENS